MEPTEEPAGEPYDYRVDTTTTSITGSCRTGQDQRILDTVRERMQQEYDSLDSARRDVHQQGGNVFETERPMSDLPAETVWSLHKQNDSRWGVAYGHAMSEGCTDGILSELDDLPDRLELVIARSAIRTEGDVLSIPLSDGVLQLSVPDFPADGSADALVSITDAGDDLTLRVDEPETDLYSRHPLTDIPDDVSEACSAITDTSGLAGRITHMTDVLSEQYPTGLVGQVLLFAAGARPAVGLPATNGRQPLAPAVAKMMGSDRYPIEPIHEEVLTNDPGCAEAARHINRGSVDNASNSETARMVGVALGYPTDAIDFYAHQTERRTPSGMLMAQTVVRLLDSDKMNRNDCAALRLIPYAVEGTEEAVLDAVRRGHQYAEALIEFDDTYGVASGKLTLSQLGYENEQVEALPPDYRSNSQYRQ